LTAADGFSRYLLGCQALPATSVAEAKPMFTRLFKEFGLPKRIRTDNGVPFATNTLARLSQLSAWWVRLGILPELIEPGKPQQNARHERMRRTLKAETTRPAANTGAGSSAGSIASARSSIASVDTRRWACKRQHHSINPRHAKCPAS
jgi:putative transposase